MEQSFYLNVNLYSDERVIEVLVIPGVEDWRIVMDGVDLGTVQHDGDSTWFWKEGDLDIEVATEVGKALESHYE